MYLTNAMKFIIKFTIFSLVFLYLSFTLIGCKSAKKVSFKTPVDTTTKYIKLQLKQTYNLTDVDVYASNDFDGARLNGFEKENDSTAIVVINPENVPINNSPYYAFKTWTNTPKTFYFKFKYPKGYKHRYIPKLKVNDAWSVIDSSSIFKEDSIVTIKLNLDRTPMIVAAQEIQSSTQVENWYTELSRGKESYVRVESAGKSNLGRNLPVLDIYKGDKQQKDLIVLITRQHPPEVTGYYAFQSFLETILENTKVSDQFLKKYRVVAFPIMNPDGVDLGHWRHNNGGVDLNRDWSLYKQPEIRQVVHYINKALRKDKTKLILGLDFHSTWYDVFYTNKIREGTTLPGFINDWFEGLEKNIPGYKVNEAAGNSTKPVSKGWFLYGHNAVGITYEIGDKTPKDSIKNIGRISAEQMMNILLN